MVRARTVNRKIRRSSLSSKRSVAQVKAAAGVRPYLKGLSDSSRRKYKMNQLLAIK
jgi:hypothetical protein